ncbi:MAG: GAF domain-containing protein [Ardenticatenales bacterium]|nr:GAF domain-containing protein [Ardenticatenales bacterium]
MQSPKVASAERRATLLHAGARVAKSVSSILDPDRLLRRTVDIICDEFGFYYAGVFLLDETGHWAVLRAGRGMAGASMIAQGHKLAVGGNSMIGAATGRGEARIALDVGEEAVFFRNPYLPQTRSEMALPLMVGNEIIGALTVQSTEEAAFTQEDIETLQSMADQLAIAIKNSRLYRENQMLLRQAERRARLLHAANEVGRRAAAILDLSELLNKAVDIICDAYGFYYAGVFLVDETGHWAVLRAGRGEAGRAMIEAGHRLEVSGNSMIGAATGRREARIALDVGEEKVHFKNPHLPHTRSEMALPLAVGDTVLGAVTVQSIEERAFSEDDIVTLQTMADHLGVAINNAYLLQELERTHAELLRTKTYEALTASTTQAIHWIGNKALPITTTIARMQTDLTTNTIDLESWRDDLDLIDESARLIVQVKENLIGPAREQQPRPAMLEDVLRSAAFHSQLPEDRLTINVTAENPMILADTTQLARAFRNLLRNALEAKATQVVVSIAPSEERGFIEMRISDDGEGIEEEMLNKVWAAFITTKGPSHNGLGLPATLHIIAQTDGRITLESTKGQGTTMSILFPAMPQGKAQEANWGGVPENILLIDDNDKWASFAESTLTEAGKQVTRDTTMDGAAKADIILVDEALKTTPLADVLAALESVGAIERTKIITPAMNVERITSYLQAGVKDVMLKPYTAADLAHVLS